MQDLNAMDSNPVTRGKSSLRLLFDVFLFIAFLASLAIYFNQELLFPKPITPVTITDNDITVDDLLLSKTGLIDENVDRFLSQVNANYSQKMAIDPQTVAFVDESYELIVKAQKQLPKNIHIYELVDLQNQQDKINRGLREANRLFKQDKLTMPRFENAFSKYEYVLALDPNNKEAMQGIRNIVDRYIFFIEKVVEKNEFFKVPILIESVRNVGENYVDIFPIVEKYKTYLSEDDLQAFYHQNTKDHDAKQYNKDDERYITKKIVKADYKISEVAIDLIKAKQVITAKQVLSEFVSLYPGKSKSYDLLLQLYMDEGNIEKAERIIYQNVQSESVYLAEKTARLFIARGDYAGALSLLESYKADFSRHPDYHYLLAGLYLKLDEYTKAKNIYEKLVSTNRYNAYYWFGLATALQAKGDELAFTGFSVAKKIATKGSIMDRYYQYASLG